MAAPNVLKSDRWLADILEFRKLPTAFFTTRQMEGDEFVLDILQALYSDKLGYQIRVVLLSTLQEKVSILMTSPALIEQVVGSLTDMYHQTSSETATFYKSQLLVTMTTVLLESGQLVDQPKLFTDFVELLLDIMSKVNSAADRTLRGTACHCLCEIETMHPGILMRKLEHFYAMSQLECTHVCQDYMALFVQVLTNSLAALLKNDDEIATSDITDLLCSRTEPLKPLTFPEGFTTKMFQLSSPKESSTRRLPENIDCKELLRSFSFLLDHLYLMTAPCIVTTLLKLTDCMALAPNVAPHILRPFVMRVESTVDVALIHVLLMLKLRFGRQLVTDAEEELLLGRLVSCTSHPSLAPGHRLLCYHWLLNFPENKNPTPASKCRLPTGLDYSKTAALYPSIFDGLDTTLIKLNLLSLCFTPSHVQDSASATLMGCLVSLQKSIHYGITGRPAVTLYRALYLYYLRHHDSVLRREIYKLIVTIVTEQPKFVPHTINFIECINRINTKDSFPVELLHSSMENIVSTPPSDILEDLEYHLLLLERVCQETTISPKPVVAFLHQLLTSTILGANGNWLLGNCILSVCHKIMQHHDTLDIFKEFGHLLYDLFTSYADLDIRDRARFYYSMLTNISSQKISSILSSAGATHSLTRLVTGSSSFDIPAPIQRLNEPILSLARIKRRPEYAMFPALSCDEYLLNLESNSQLPVIHMDYYLHFAQTTDIPASMEKLYALILHVDVPKSYKEISDVSIPCLALDESSSASDSCQVISLCIQPLEPVPSKLLISTMFSTAEGQTCTFSLPPVTIQFSDLFLPMPVEPCHGPKLFDNLWDYFRMQSSGSYAESVCTLLMDKTAVLDVIHRQLIEYKIDAVEEDDALRFGIFLPPAWHLLLKISPNQELTVVTIVTDNWKILPLINAFLHQFESQSAK